MQATITKPRPNTRSARVACVAVLVATALTTASCGTLLYPERRGQTSGRIDPGVAILDGVGLLVFVVPGLVAFGVDFVTGAIYLPGRRTTADAGDGADGEATTVAYTLSARPSVADIELVVARETGLQLDLSKDAYAYEVASPERVAEECRKLVVLDLL